MIQENVVTHNLGMVVTAHNYLKLGFSVLPVKGNFYARGSNIEEMAKDSKAPLVPWTEYQGRLPTEKETKSWFLKYPKANIAIITGKVSSIVVVDFDSIEAVRWARGEGLLNNTLTARTARGYHAYFKYPEGKAIKNFVNFNGMKIDIRSDGGYVIAPPSTHMTGVEYTWQAKVPPAALPEFFVDTISRTSTSETTDLKPFYRGVTKGSRNNTLAKLCGSWINDGLSYAECIEMAEVWNSKNNPPMPHGEMTRTVQSIYSREKSKKKKPTIYHEKNLLRLPLFVRDRKKTGELKVIVYVNGNDKVRREWKVSPSLEWGLPGPFDETVFMAINKTLSDMPKPIANPVDIGPLREIARQIGYPHTGGNVIKSIKESILRIRGLTLVSNSVFYSAQKKKYLTDAFGVFDRAIFRGEQTPDGEKSTSNLIWLSQVYLANINENFTDMIDYDRFLALSSPISRGIYKIIMPIRSAANGLPIRISYSKLRQLLQVEEMKCLSKVKEQLRPAHQELLERGIFVKINIMEKKDKSKIIISYTH